MSRRLLLTAHLIASLGWLGALLVFLAHAVASVASQDEQIVRGAAIGMGIAAWFVILPLSLVTLVTGLAQALGSAWGLLRHYWIAFKLVLTVIATAVLLLKLAPISHLGAAASTVEFTSATLPDLRLSILLHATGGLIILLAAAVLAVYKPAGLTPFAGEATVVPRWVKVCGAGLILLLALVLVMVLSGGHGPRAHGS